MVATMTGSMTGPHPLPASRRSDTRQKEKSAQIIFLCMVWHTGTGTFLLLGAMSPVLHAEGWRTLLGVVVLGHHRSVVVQKR